MRAWVDWVNTPRANVSPLVAAALAHYQFEVLHPFNDGNGRIGRLVIVLHLMMRGVLHEPILAVSPWFEARRSDYQDALLRVSETGDWDRWVSFFLTALRAQADDAIRIIDELLKFRDKAREQCRVGHLRGTALDVAESLIARPVLTPQWVQRHFAVSYPAANNAVARLEKLGLVRETTGGRYGRVFAADEVMRILVGRG